MLFSQDKTRLVLIKAKSITVYPGKNVLPVKQALSDQWVTHQEVIDSTALTQALKTVFAKFDLNKNTLTVLGDDVVYQKRFTPPISSDYDPRINEFLETIPFENEALAHRYITAKDTSVIFAVSKVFVETITEALGITNPALTGIVPLSAFGVGFHDPLRNAEVESILSNTLAQQAFELMHPKKYKPVFGLPYFITIFVLLLIWMSLLVWIIRK